MRNRQELTEAFNSMQGRYADLCSEVRYSLDRGINLAGVKIHSVSSRPKALESFLGKVERKKYTDPFTQCEDLAAARVVCLFMSDLGRIRTVIENHFQVISRQDKVQDGDAATFGYMSQHYTCKLSGRHSGPRYDHISDLKFEIQVRTILMDAWANISHYLSYKNEDSIPLDMLRDFHALSGLLYVADRQFETLARASSQYAANAENDIVHAGQSVSEINADTVAALLLKLFGDREASDEYSISDFVQEVISFGYTDLRALSADIEAGLEAALEEELEEPPVAQPGETDDGLFSRVGIARTSLKHSQPGYHKKLRRKWNSRLKFEE
ncbi:GTP pyrophosphokinase [Streptomyces anandii]|uniref:GTP pyrophosphokinase n=1 Tax=Streptomyces anandii TaxID=285454 RepID=UPI003693486E